MSDDGQLQFLNFRPQPPTRARAKDHKHGDLLKALTIGLVDTYSQCSSEFKYTSTLAPRRVLTKLAKGVHNSGYDNAEHDYICRVSDKIKNPDEQTYEIIERLGHGTFGQVLKVLPASGQGNGPVALKIIKNKPAYFHQALVEVHILKMLNSQYDRDDECRIVRMIDFFVYRKHLCIAFELLSVNLYDVLKQNAFRGVSMALIRVLTEQLLKALLCLREASVIHCDLKPENVLLSNMQHTRIKLIDFGSACFENHTVYSYIQSRFYRSPEVLLGLPYTTAVDMWSLGCICAELFLGLPIFPGHSEYDQICRIVDVQGAPGARMLDLGKNTKKFFRKEEEIVERQSAPKDGDGAETSARSAGGSECSGSQQSEIQNKDAGADGNGSTNSANVGNTSTLADDAVTEPPKACAEATAPTVAESKSESFIDLLKRKVGLNPEPLPPAPALPEKKAESEGGQSATGSTGSTTMDKQDSLHHGTDTSVDMRGLESDTSTAAAPQQNPEPNTDGAEARTVGSGIADGAEARTVAPGITAGAEVRTVAPGPAKATTKVQRRRRWRLKTREEYERDEHKKEPTPKKYFDFNSLEQMVEQLPYKHNLSRRAKAEEKDRRRCFLQFLWGVMQLNPDVRATPHQAVATPFITGAVFDPNFIAPDDEPVPSFTKAAQHIAKSSTLSVATGKHEKEAGDVPRLSADALTEGNFLGGGSARTWNENQGTVAGHSDSDQPRSAPATSRQQPAVQQSSGPQHVANASSETGGKSHRGLDMVPDIPALAAMRGLWAQLYQGVPLPDDTQAESYRPPIEHLPDDFFRVSPRSAISAASAASMKKRSGLSGGDPGNASTGASFCSSASSAGSTPSHPHSGGRPNLTAASPSVASPSFSGRRRTTSGKEQPKVLGSGRHPVSGTSGTPATSPSHGPVPALAGGPSGTPGSTAQTPQRGGVPHTAGAVPRGCAAGSRDGSRGSSPWHLPSPMSELSTASDRVNSSHPSGSDSCGENVFHDGQPFDECPFSGEDPSQSESHNRSHQPSDSDGTLTPGSHDAMGTQRVEESKKDPQHALWENIKSEMARVELSRDRLPRRLDITQSPGSAGAMGNFREKMGMNESGPVIPFGHGARRDATGTGASASLFTPPGRESGTTEDSNQQALGTRGSSQAAGGRPVAKKTGGPNNPSGPGVPGNTSQ